MLELDHRYRILERIGGGAMGNVFRGEHVALQRAVAIKMISPELVTRPDVRERFFREARAQARLTHPNVVATLDFGDSASGPYLVLEHVDGHALECELAAGPLAVDRVIGLGLDIAEGLAAAHAGGIIHRDLKPANILISRSNGRDVAKLADFGLAAVHDEVARLTAGGPLGTPAYIAPEQALGKPVDSRADVYAFGCTLFELVIGRPPYAGNSIEVLFHHINAPIPRIVELDPTLPLELDRLIGDMMAKDPRDRPASGAEVATRLREVASPPSVAVVAVLGVATGALTRAVEAIVEAAGGAALERTGEAWLARFGDADAAARAASAIVRLAGGRLRAAVDVGTRATAALIAAATSIAALATAGESLVSARLHAALSLGARGRFRVRGVRVGVAPDAVLYSSSPGELPPEVAGHVVGAHVEFRCPCGHSQYLATDPEVSRYDALCDACGGVCRVECATRETAVEATAETPAADAIALPSRARDDDRRLLSDLADLE